MRSDESHELLRSAYAIAKRNGEDTNWDAFLKCLRRELLHHAGLPDSIHNESIVGQATCTPRTYRLPHAVVANG